MIIKSEFKLFLSAALIGVISVVTIDGMTRDMVSVSSVASREFGDSLLDSNIFLGEYALQDCIPQQEQAYRCEWCGNHYPDGISLHDHWNVCQAQQVNSAARAGGTYHFYGNGEFVADEAEFDGLQVPAPASSISKALKRSHDADLEEEWGNSKRGRVEPYVDVEADVADIPEIDEGDEEQDDYVQNEEEKVPEAEVVFQKKKKRIRNESETREYCCSQCDTSFVQKSELDTHTLIHTGERPFACPQCDMSFVHRGNLNTHMRKHTGEKPFKCPLCSLSCSQKGNLKKHMKHKHAGVSEAIFNHMQTYSEGKPFKCALCDYGSNQSANLKRHMKRKHAVVSEARFNHISTPNRYLEQEASQQEYGIQEGQEKKSDVQKQDTYECSYCHQLSKSKIALRNHIRIHKRKIRACDACGKNFAYMGSLNRHILQCSKQIE